MSIIAGKPRAEEPPTNGPEDPLRPIGALEVLKHPDSQVQAIRQQYADGFIYEYALPMGSRVGPRVYDVSLPFFTSRLLRIFEDEGKHYFTLWVPNREVQKYDKLSQATARLGINYKDVPKSDPEVLHEDARLTVSRARLADGWLYLVDTELGYPCPSPFVVPSLTPTRSAPVISVERSGTRYTAKYWVSDTAPYAPAAA